MVFHFSVSRVLLTPLVCQVVLFFLPYCLSSSLAAPLRAQLRAFLEVTGNVSDGCEAGSAVKGT